MISTPVALITGSAKKRIGWNVADALAKRGYSLVIHSHRSIVEAEEAIAEFSSRGIAVLAVQADLADEQAVTKMFQRIFDHFGRIDVLVNCAAEWWSKKLEEVTAEDVRRFFNSNTLGTFLCCQHAGLTMVKQSEGGNIVTLGDWAIERPYLNYSAYFSSKGAIPALTRTFAVELGTRNPKVRVNCIHPGPVMLPADLPEDERRDAIAATILKREGSRVNVAQAVLFLIDNDFVTGTCLTIDGGRSIYE